MSKYDSLFMYLSKLSSEGGKVWFPTFEEVERILGFELPPSAYGHQAWWANEVYDGTHVQKHAWMKAGWKTERVDLSRRTVNFIKEVA